MNDRWHLRDVLPAVLAGTVPVVALLAQSHAPPWAPEPDRFLDPWGAALGVLAALALLWRRRSPLVALGVVAASLSLYMWLGYPYGPPMLLVLLAVYSVAAHRPMRVAVIGAALAGLLLLSHLLSPTAPAPGPGTGIAAAWFVVAFTIGLVVRTRREQRTRARDEVLRQHLSNERLSLSRDVHDVVGHGLAAINMQARVALRSVDREDEHGRERVRSALEAISDSSAAALAELRTVLTQIPTGGADTAPLHPGPGLADLPALVARLEPTGLRVLVRDEGDGSPVPAAVDLAAYRVVQEALTNALRHGEVSTAVDVVVERRPDAVRLEVSNAVGQAATTTDGGGMGIPSMRDRVATVGGTLEIDPGPPRFVVRAMFGTKEAS